MNRYRFPSLLQMIIFQLVWMVLGCATLPPEAQKPQSLQILPESEKVFVQTPDVNGSFNQIDVEQLLHELDMDRPLSQLGFQEKSFNTCEIKSNNSTRPLCQRLYLVRLNFHILCRDSVGTVSTVNLQPFHSNRLRWRQQGFRGVTSTTPSGFGSLGFISPHSSAAGHLYFYLDGKIARKSLRDNWKLVLPQSWCEEAL
jgi:hypothetical protein